MTSYKTLRANAKSAASTRLAKIARASGGPVPNKAVAVKNRKTENKMTVDGSPAKPRLDRPARKNMFGGGLAAPVTPNDGGIAPDAGISRYTNPYTRLPLPRTDLGRPMPMLDGRERLLSPDQGTPPELREGVPRKKGGRVGKRPK